MLELRPTTHKIIRNGVALVSKEDEILNDRRADIGFEPRRRADASAAQPANSRSVTIVTVAPARRHIRSSYGRHRTAPPAIPTVSVAARCTLTATLEEPSNGLSLASSRRSAPNVASGPTETSKRAHRKDQSTKAEPSGDAPQDLKRGRDRSANCGALRRPGTESLLTLCWREMDSNHRFPARIKRKDGARRRGSAYPGERADLLPGAPEFTGATDSPWRELDSNSPRQS
jgi:hypothetical protein